MSELERSTSEPIAEGFETAKWAKETQTPPSAFLPEQAERLASIDAYRGFVMFLMMAEVLRLRTLASKHWIWERLAYHQTHVEWIGCSLHDMIQPSFSFLVGVALPFSIASRRRKGQTPGRMVAHAAWRALILTFLGVFLRSVGRPRTNFTFEDTLSQIGLGYLFLFMLGLAKVRTQVIALVVILVGYWIAFAAYPIPGDVSSVVGKSSASSLSGFEAHWSKNTNIAWKFDTWFLNLFPRDKPFEGNGGGYATLSFIPTLGTMILGLLAGNLLRAGGSRWGKVGLLILAGLISLGAGYGIGYLGYCPVVKKIWTPTWVLFSGGWCFLFLAGIYATVDLLKLRPVFFPLIVIGVNSIAAYCLSHLIDDFIVGSYRTHFGKDVFKLFGTDYAPFVQGWGVLAALWLILFWMYRKKLYVRI